MSRQKTISKPVTVEGRGLFSGEPCTMQFLPASADTGIVFVRQDLGPDSRVTADIAHLAQCPRRTSLTDGAAAVETVEHVLSACSGMGVDNVIIQLNAAEPPSPDGSPQAFVRAIQQAGVVELECDQSPFVIDEPVTVSDAPAMLTALPGPADCLDILYDLDYAETPSIGRQVMGFRVGKDDYAAQLGGARTFLLEGEAKALQAQGMGKHLSGGDILVMGDNGPLDGSLRFPDEHVRHKVVDLVGDLALLGRPIRGRIVACRSGHELNHALVAKLATRLAAKLKNRNMRAEPVMDTRRIMRLLPHRYPFLMIDRIIHVDGDRQAIAIKNVTINEPYFVGHFPALPIMPAVMILEAMAQLAGILVGQRLEHAGKIGMLLSMDRVKIRRPVRPGDQLILEAQTLHIRPRTGHCRCRALVGEEIVAEAEIKFMLVDGEPA